MPDATRDLLPNSDLCGYPGYDSRRSYARLVKERAPHQAHHDPMLACRAILMLYAGMMMKNDMTNPELCIERLISFSLSIEPSLQSAGGAPEASVGQRYA